MARIEFLRAAYIHNDSAFIKKCFEVVFISKKFIQETHKNCFVYCKIASASIIAP
jgi:hypothetical protein